MKIGVIGAGRLGISFALLCEKNGYDVIVSDLRENYVNDLNNKKIITNEPQILSMLQKSKKIVATLDNTEVIEKSDMIFIFVATPSTIHGSYDTSSLNQVIFDLEKLNENGINLSGKKVIVGCTTNPGDVELIEKRLKPFGVSVAYNPEFIAQGEIIKGLEESDIVLIGTSEPHVADELINLYEKIQTTNVNPQVMSIKSAEITKISINCFLTTKISFANMIGDIMIKSNLEREINQVLSAIGNDSRVGTKYMKYGFGFGGPCLPRDNRALGHYASKVGMELNIPLTVDKFNKEHSAFLKNHFINKNPKKDIPFIMDYITYKKGTDIIEESQQFQLLTDLIKEGYTVMVPNDDFTLEKIKNLRQDYPNQIIIFNPESNSEGFKINF